jgi:eukaryotic-like serine/threonine-protein kinase
MLYEMLAGMRPVAGDDARVIALKVEQGDVMPLVKVAPEVPGELAGLVHRAMAARPELRFATATEMRLALEKVRRGGTAVLGVGPRTDAVPAIATVAGMMQNAPTAATSRSEAPESPPVHTMRAPPIASALAGVAYEGAPLVAEPPQMDRRRARRRGRVLLALVALPLVLGGGIVGALALSGTWAAGDTPAALPSASTPLAEEDVAPRARPVPTQTSTSTVSDVPKLVPTRPISAPTQPHAPARSASPAPADAGPPPSPFLLPSTLPSTLPPFPSVLPFPTNFPNPFPSILPAWPPPPPSSSQPPRETPSANGPGY